MSDDELVALKKKLEAAAKARDQFLSNVAHELRSPLSTMLMHAQMLKAGDMSPEEQKKTGEAIERATARQTQTVDDLVDVARATAGALSHQPQPISFGAIARAAADNMTPIATKKGVTIHVDVGAKGGDILGDVTRLTQAVRHVVNNAVRFTPKGGTVTVRAGEEEGKAVVRVTDTGPGVEAAWLPFLFNRITDPEMPDRPKPQGGIGYGLSLAHHVVVTQHHGEIALESSSPQGATFKVSLPLRSKA
jgi:two-component system, chemotaxis family, CheB/CheR fusion protein